jgi:hypothetical protein
MFVPHRRHAYGLLRRKLHFCFTFSAACDDNEKKDPQLHNPITSLFLSDVHLRSQILQILAWNLGWLCLWFFNSIAKSFSRIKFENSSVQLMAGGSHFVTSVVFLVLDLPNDVFSRDFIICIIYHINIFVYCRGLPHSSHLLSLFFFTLFTSTRVLCLRLSLTFPVSFLYLPHLEATV